MSAGFESKNAIRFFVISVTALSIVVSVLLTVVLMYLTGLGLQLTNLAVSVAVPAIVAPMVSWGVARAYTELSLAQEQLKKVAQTDALTGLLNRLAFADGAEAVLRAKEGQTRAPCLLYVDVDHFKRINDTFGHIAGDEALRLLSGCMRECCRSTDLIGRIGGEEFAIMLSNAGVDGGERTAERIRRAVADIDFTWHGARLGMTVSIGIAPCRDDEDLDDLLMFGDTALYQAKAAGRNCCILRNDDGNFQPCTVKNNDSFEQDAARRTERITVPLSG